MSREDEPHEVWEGLPACHACRHVSMNVHVIPADVRMVECERCGHEGIYLGEPGSPERTPPLQAVEERDDG